MKKVHHGSVMTATMHCWFVHDDQPYAKSFRDIPKTAVPLPAKAQACIKKYFTSKTFIKEANDSIFESGNIEGTVHEYNLPIPKQTIENLDWKIRGPAKVVLLKDGQGMQVTFSIAFTSHDKELQHSLPAACAAVVGPFAWHLHKGSIPVVNGQFLGPYHVDVDLISFKLL